MLLRFLLPTVFLLTICASTACAGAPQPHKKIIHYGWDTPDTRWVRENAALIAQAPFDGIAINVAIDRAKPTKGDGATENILGWQVHSARRLALSQFRAAIADLRSVSWKQPRHHFLPIAVAGGAAAGMNWFDDDRWRIIVNNWQVVASIAKRAGCKGIMFDPEHYGPAPFDYREQAKMLDHPFADYAAKARERGRQVMRAVNAVYPGITIFCLFAYTLPPHYMEHYKEPALEKNHYGLLPAFLDGMTEAASPRARFVDGYELSYAYKQLGDFQQAYQKIRRGVLSITAVPELYKQRWQAGFGLMLDYTATGWDTTDLSKNYFPPSDFRQALLAALQTTDEYVWIYSERPSFLPRADLPPEYVNAIFEGRDAAKSE